MFLPYAALLRRAAGRGTASEGAAWGGCVEAAAWARAQRRRLRGWLLCCAGWLRGGGRVGAAVRGGGGVRRIHQKKQPREFSQTPGVNDVCQFMASISGVDIVCDDYMAK